MLGRIEGRRRRGQQSWLDDITDVNLGKLGVDDEQGGLVCCSPLGRKESDTTG